MKRPLSQDRQPDFDWSDEDICNCDTIVPPQTGTMVANKTPLARKCLIKFVGIKRAKAAKREEGEEGEDDKAAGKGVAKEGLDPAAVVCGTDDDENDFCNKFVSSDYDDGDDHDLHFGNRVTEEIILAGK